MFSKLKERLNNWTKKVSESSEIEESKKKSEKKSPKEEKQEKKKEKPKKIKAQPEEKFFSKIKPVKKVKISEKNFEIYSEELRMLLLENNVAYEVAEKIIQELKQRIIDKEFLKKEAVSEIKDSFKDIIKEILVQPFNLSERIKQHKKRADSIPYVILFCGINGSGKTTTIAKIAEYLQKNNLSCVLSASDTFRAASIEQLKKHGSRLNAKVISQEYGADPAAVGFDAVQYAKKHHINAVLIDTAGRMHSSKNLMSELEKINKVTKPDLKIFVGESITGNDAVEQVKSFDWAVNIDAIILTKADIDEKGGTALSVSYITKKPILFLGTGQEYDKIKVFSKEQFIKELGL